MIAVGYYLKVLAPDNDLKDKLLLNLTILIVISDQLWALGWKKSFFLELFTLVLRLHQVTYRLVYVGR